MAMGSRLVPCAHHRPRKLHQILGDHGKLSKWGSGVPIGQIHVHVSCGGLHALLGPLKGGPSPQLGSQPWTPQTGASESQSRTGGPGVLRQGPWPDPGLGPRCGEPHAGGAGGGPEARGVEPWGAWPRPLICFQPSL